MASSGPVPQPLLMKTRIQLSASDYIRSARSRQMTIPSVSAQCKSTHMPIRRLRRALPVHDLRRELGGLAEVDEVGRHRVARRQPLEIGELAPCTTSSSTRPKNAVADLAGLRVARVEIDQPLDRLRDPARRNLRGQPAEASRRDRARRRRPSRSTAARARRRACGRCPGSRSSRCDAGRSRSGSR